MPLEYLLHRKKHSRRNLKVCQKGFRGWHVCIDACICKFKRVQNFENWDFKDAVYLDSRNICVYWS